MNYDSFLSEARAADLSDLDYCGWLSIIPSPSSEENGVPIVVICPRLASFDGSESMLRRMVLYFVKRLDVIANKPFIIVYCHMLSITSAIQKLMLSMYYGMLPAEYSKNLKRLFIVYNNNDTFSFFSKYAKSYIDQKFLKKIVFADTLSDLHRKISPVSLPLSYRLVKLDDDLVRGALTLQATVGTANTTTNATTNAAASLPVTGATTSVLESFVPFLGTTLFMYQCIKFLRDRNSHLKQGIFRTSANDAELSLLKNRILKKNSSTISLQTLLEFMYQHYPLVEFDENTLPEDSEKLSVVVGDSYTIGGVSGMLNTSHLLAIPSNYEEKIALTSTTNSSQSELCTLYVSDIDVVANGIKFYLRGLAQPLIPYQLFDYLFPIAVSYMKGTITREEWIGKALDLLTQMPHAHFSTFKHLFTFLAEISKFSSINLMTSTNLGIAFAPCLMRSRPGLDDSNGNEETESILFEMSVYQLITTSLIEHFEKLSSLGVLDHTSGEAVVTDCIGYGHRDAIPSFVENEVFWYENIVPKYQKLQVNGI